MQFILKKERKPDFKFCSLQSPKGRAILAEHGVDPERMDTLVFIKNGKVYTKSGAALRISLSLKGLWPISIVFLVIPSFIRDYIYSWVAKNRYSWFGKSEVCYVPTPELQARFLDT